MGNRVLTCCVRSYTSSFTVANTIDVASIVLILGTVAVHMPRRKNKILIHAAFRFLPWLLGRSCFISPLYWGRHCINRHTGNRPPLSEEPLRRGPGPMARFPTLRYRPEHNRHLDCNDEESLHILTVSCNSRQKTFWITVPVWMYTGVSRMGTLDISKKNSSSCSQNIDSFTIHLLSHASFTECHDVNSCYPQQCA